MPLRFSAVQFKVKGVEVFLVFISCNVHGAYVFDSVEFGRRVSIAEEVLTVLNVCPCRALALAF